MTEYPTLRDANQARQREWDTGNQITLAYRGNELAGEAGEACNVIKKLERERLGIRGSRATPAQLAEELADVVICADLIAMDAGRDLQMNSGWRAGIGGGAEWGAHLAVCVGRLCDNILLQEQRHLTSICMDVERAARGIAARYSIDLDAAVKAKFNATSEKLGLATRLSSHPQDEVLCLFCRKPLGDETDCLVDDNGEIACKECGEAEYACQEREGLRPPSTALSE